MKAFKHLNATTIKEAVALSQEKKTRLIAGGTDLIGALKDRILPVYPETVINIKTIPDMAYITDGGGGLKIGALTRLNDIVNSEAVKEKYAVLAQAARSVSSPHIRQMGTIGGNLCQGVRCWYYRASMWEGKPFICLRKGGKLCYAKVGDNRYHSIFGAPKGCYAVHPSDTAPAFVALNAKFKTTKRTIAAQDFFDSLTDTTLKANEIVTEIQVPAPPAGTRSTYVKFGVRKALDFAIVSAAVVLTVEGGRCREARIVLGGVAPTPWRSAEAEKAMKGKSINDASATAAASAALARAKPLKDNKYKVQIAKATMKNAIIACV